MTSFEHEEAGMTETMHERMGREAEALNERIRTCHERLACPKCKQPVGKKCVKMSSRPLRSADPGLGVLPPIECKHPHRQRWEQETPAR